MRLSRRRSDRRGAILPLFALSLIPMMALLALAIDLGLLSLARTQCQAAADSAALAGVRKLDGNYTGGHNGNYAAVQPAAQASLNNNKVLANSITATNPATSQPYGTVATLIGSYRYVRANNGFVEDFSSPGPAQGTDPNTSLPMPWTLVRSTVTYTAPTRFASWLWNIGGTTLTASAAAVHRPRDISIIVDLSGSMSFDSNLGVPWADERNRTNNPDRAYPRFGGYSYAVSKQNGTNVDAYDMYQNAASNVANNSSGIDGPWNCGNITVNPHNVNSTFLDCDPIVLDFYTGSPGSLTQAWPAGNFPAVSGDGYDPPAQTIPITAASKSANDFQDVPGGDNYLTKNMNSSSATAYARTVQELTGTTTTTTRRGVETSSNDADFEVFGYGGLNTPQAGYPSGSSKLSDVKRPDLADLTGRTDYQYAGYTQGPRYWGKTYFMWPPDPRQPITSTPRLTWNSSTSTWSANASPGLLNKWLIDLDRNFILLPNGPRTNSTGGVVGLTRYAAGSYDALLANWPLDNTGARRTNCWTRQQVERFLRGQDPTTGTDLRTSFNQTAKNKTPSSPGSYVADLYNTSTYRAAPALPANVPGWTYGTTTAFWSGPVISPANGAGISGGYPKLYITSTGTSTGTTDNSIITAGSGVGSGNLSATGVAVPSPALLTVAAAIPTSAPSGATTQVDIDGQIARLILGLYDNIEANYDWRKIYTDPPSSGGAWPVNSTLFTNKTLQDGNNNNITGASGYFFNVPAASSGTGSWHIDYAAILKWIKTTGPNPFPTSLRCGRIVFYTSIPDSISLQVPTNSNERFWKEYIDFVLGCRSVNVNASTYGESHHYTGYGRDFDFNGSSINSTPTDQSVVAVKSVDSTSGTATDRGSFSRLATYMDYRDNPMRPKTRLWFGPMTMVDFIINTNLSNPFGSSAGRVGTNAPGACHQSQNIGCKLGVRAALLDSKINHPNDMVTLMFFSGTDMTSGTPDRFRVVRAELSTRYDDMVDYLFFPPSTVNSPGTEINWTDGNMNEVPNGNGGTCYDLPLMLTYNQFSGNSNLISANSGEAAGNGGGYGRNTAQKVIIFESDGVANTKCTPTSSFQTVSDGKHYYSVRKGDSVSLAGVSPWSSGNLLTIAAKLGANVTSQGYSYSNKPLLLHTLGFGFLFEPGYSNTTQTAAALDCFKQLQGKGNVDDTTTGVALHTGSSVAEYKIITGTLQQRVDKLQTAFTKILQEQTVQISLIE